MRLFAFRKHQCADPWKSPDAPPWAVELRSLLALILYQQELTMATLDEVLSEVTDENTRLDSIQSLIDGIKQQLADALAGTTLPPATQAKVDAVFATLTSSKSKIDKALNVNVPAPAPTQ